MTVAANIALVPRLLAWTDARVSARVDELLALVGLEPPTYRDRWPDRTVRRRSASASAWPARWRPIRRCC